MEFREMQVLAHRTAQEKGWWDRPRMIPEQIALMHSELSEALEEYRNGHLPDVIRRRESDGKPEGFGIELADCIIRILDTAAYYGVDMQHMITVKLEFNKSRPFRHGRKGDLEA